MALENHDKEFKRTRCQIFSRNNGYLQPVANWNEGKKSEWKERKTFINKI